MILDDVIIAFFYRMPSPVIGQYGTGDIHPRAEHG